jgi:hypothetical protein
VLLSAQHRSSDRCIEGGMPRARLRSAVKRALLRTDSSTSPGAACGGRTRSAVGTGHSALRGQRRNRGIPQLGENGGTRTRVASTVTPRAVPRAPEVQQASGSCNGSPASLSCGPVRPNRPLTQWSGNACRSESACRPTRAGHRGGMLDPCALGPVALAHISAMRGALVRKGRFTMHRGATPVKPRCATMRRAG